MEALGNFIQHCIINLCIKQVCAAGRKFLLADHVSLAQNCSTEPARELQLCLPMLQVSKECGSRQGPGEGRTELVASGILHWRWLCHSELLDAAHCPPGWGLPTDPIPSHTCSLFLQQFLAKINCTKLQLDFLQCEEKKEERGQPIDFHMILAI